MSIFQGKPRRFYGLGDVDSGKSVFSEVLGSFYMKYGHQLFDLWASLDCENLGWLRTGTSSLSDGTPKDCPYNRGAKILLTHGPSVELVFDKKSYETKITSQVSDADFDYYDFIITTPRFYPLIDWDERYAEMALVIRRLMTFRDAYKRIIFTIIREASEILYSRLKSWESTETTKAQIIQLLNKSRHAGLAFWMDNQKYTDLDKSARDAADYKIFKRLDHHWFPSDVEWVKNFIDPSKMVSIDNDQFAVIARDGGVFIGRNNYPPWHKTEEESLLKELGIRILYKESPHLSELKGGKLILGDAEHSELVRLCIEERQNLPAIKVLTDHRYHELGLKTHISTETIARHLRWHDESVSGRDKSCDRCRRSSSQLLHTLTGKSAVELDSVEDEVE